MTVLGIIIHLLLSSLLTAAPREKPAVAVVHNRLPAVASRLTVERDQNLPMPRITAEAAGVWDPLTRTWLFEQSADTQFPIASITKLMTVLVVLDTQPDFDAELTIAQQDNDAPGARIPIPDGGRFRLRDLLAASLVASANNTTEALVRAAGIDEADCVARMNDRAARMGMLKSHFTDVTGLGPRNVSTIHDLAILAQAVFAYPEVASLTTTKEPTITDRASGTPYRVVNTDQLVGSDLRVTAGKTGYTDAAGGALITRVKGIGERELFVLVLESAGRNDRFSDVRMLADWAFATFRWRGGA
ncbi:MAG: serine hydrolase [bacterium]